MYGINTIRHIFCLTEAIFIANDSISLVFIGCVIASGRFQINLKGSTLFRSFNLCFSIISVFNDSHIAFDYLLGYIIGSKVVFHLIKFRVCTYFMDSLIKQIALWRCNFSDCPVGITNIFFGSELTVFISNIFIYKCFALIDTVNCSRKFGIALCFAFLSVALCYCYSKFLQNVIEVSCGYFFPLHWCSLIFRHNITDSRVYFFKGIWFRTTDKHIFESCHTVIVRNCILVNSITGKRSTEKMELHTFNKVIFWGLHYLKVATLQFVIESDLCNLSCYNSNSMCFLRLVLIVCLLGYGIDTRHKVINLELTAISCCNRLIDTVSGNREVDTVNLAVLTGLYNLTRTIADFHLHITVDTVAYFLSIADNILHTGVLTVFTLWPYNHTSADCIFLRCGNGKFLTRCSIHRNSKFVTIHWKAHSTDTCLEIIFGQHIIGVCQSSCVLASVPLKFYCLCRTGWFITKAWYGRMVLYTLHHTVVITENLIAERMLCIDDIFHIAATTGCYMIEVRITLSDNSFPDKKLCGISLCNAVCCCFILWPPRCRDCPTIAIL